MKKISIMLIVILSVVLLAGCGGQEAAKEVEPTPAIAPTIEPRSKPILEIEDVQYEDLKISIEKQEATEKGRKVVVRFENVKTDSLFDGSIHVKGDNKLIDTIFVDYLVTGTNGYAIIFDGNYSNTYNYDLTGKMTEHKIIKTGEYEIIFQKSGAKFITLYAQTNNKEPDNLKQICKGLVSSYPRHTLSGMQVYFFDDSVKLTKGSMPPTKVLSDYFATYTLNRNNQESEITYSNSIIPIYIDDPIS